KIHGEAFNFSNEQPLSVIEITQLILQVMGREDLKPEIRNEASNEIPEQWLSSEKAKKMLDWKAKFSIKEGLAETVEWYKELLK
ncbi:MAG: NAD-dependent epimerase/dehydratase family protein, partial [Candidatus Heimdallarchaeota archaeon]